MKKELSICRHLSQMDDTYIDIGHGNTYTRHNINQP
jgi:hypothetical protein